MSKNPHAKALGRLGGKSKSAAKLKAINKNLIKARAAKKEKSNGNITRIESIG